MKTINMKQLMEQVLILNDLGLLAFMHFIYYCIKNKYRKCKCMFFHTGSPA